MQQGEQLEMRLREELGSGPAIANDGGEQIKISCMSNFFSE